ncbi:Uncharacterized protein HZ326_13727 [Fusarium oxysporum f. sp. albedinis]|nr:Uncharacterized protein HZ326_13727 [Fusarium oxysporum f. sp. albedinis]
MRHTPRFWVDWPGKLGAKSDWRWRISLAQEHLIESRKVAFQWTPSPRQRQPFTTRAHHDLDSIFFRTSLHQVALCF